MFLIPIEVTTTRLLLFTSSSAITVLAINSVSIAVFSNIHVKCLVKDNKPCTKKPDEKLLKIQFNIDNQGISAASQASPAQLTVSISYYYCWSA